jgi:hypothetical protein
MLRRDLEKPVGIDPPRAAENDFWSIVMFRGVDERFASGDRQSRQGTGGVSDIRLGEMPNPQRE